MDKVIFRLLVMALLMIISLLMTMDECLLDRVYSWIHRREPSTMYVIQPFILYVIVQPSITHVMLCYCWLF